MGDIYSDPIEILDEPNESQNNPAEIVSISSKFNRSQEFLVKSLKIGIAILSIIILQLVFFNLSICRSQNQECLTDSTKSCGFRNFTHVVKIFNNNKKCVCAQKIANRLKGCKQAVFTEDRNKFYYGPNKTPMVLSIQDDDMENKATSKKLKLKSSISCFWIGEILPLPSNQLASATNDACTTRTENSFKINIWNISDGSFIKSISNFSNVIWTLALLPNGHLASGCRDGLIYVWDLKSGELVQTLMNHTKEVIKLLVLPDKDVLVSSSFDSTINIWNYTTGKVIKTLTDHNDTVRGLAVLSNGDLASGSYDKTIKIWNTNDWTVKKTLSGHKNDVICLAALPNGGLLSSSKGSFIRVWDTVNGVEIKTIKGHNDRVYALVVLPDGNVVSGSADKTIRLWRSSDWSAMKIIKDHEVSIHSLALLKNDRYLASAGQDTEIFIRLLE